MTAPMQWDQQMLSWRQHQMLWYPHYYNYRFRALRSWPTPLDLHPQGGCWFHSTHASLDVCQGWSADQSCDHICDTCMVSLCCGYYVRASVSYWRWKMICHSTCICMAVPLCECAGAVLDWQTLGIPTEYCGNT